MSQLLAAFFLLVAPYCVCSGPPANVDIGKIEVRHLHLAFGDGNTTVRVGFSTNRSEWSASFQSVCAYWPEQEGEKAIAYAESDFVRTYDASAWKAHQVLKWDLRFVELNNLQAFRYCVACGLRDSTGQLHLAVNYTIFDNRPVGGKWSFVAFGDMGVEASDSNEGKSAVGFTRKRVEHEVLNQSARFVLHYGDISYARGTDHIWDEFLDAIEPVASRVPWMVSPGNHEIQTPDSGHEKGVPYFARFWMPKQCAGNPYWYSFDYGGAHFVSLSTEHDFGNGTAQYSFLEEDLRQASGKYHFIVVVGHRPFISSHQGFGKDHDQLAKGQWEAWQPLFEKYNVDLTLWGHVHAYERAWAGNIPHITSGMAGQSYCCGAWENDPPDWSIFREDSHGFLRVNVNLEQRPASMHVEYVRSDDGKVYDSFTVLSQLGGNQPQSTRKTQLQRPPVSNSSALRRLSGCHEEDSRPASAVVPVVPPGLCPKISGDESDDAVIV